MRAGFQFSNEMTFTITYRAKDGALREEAVEAANRAECVAECRKRGIAPTKIAEGGRVSARAAGAGGNSKRTTASWAVAAVVAVVAVAGGVWWWMGREEPQPAPAEKPAKAKEEKPKPQPPAPPPAPAPPVAEKPAKKKDFVFTNKVGRIVRDDKVTEDENGNLWFMGSPVPTVCAGDGWLNGRKLGTPEHFKHPSENYWAQMVLSDLGGASSAPSELPKGLVRDMYAQLRTPVEIDKDDPPDGVQLKKDVIDLKAELAARVDAGEKLEDIMVQLQKDINYYASMREGYRDGLRILQREDATAQEIKDYIDAANKILEQNGVKKLNVPIRIKQKLLKHNLTIDDGGEKK